MSQRRFEISQSNALLVVAVGNTAARVITMQGVRLGLQQSVEIRNRYELIVDKEELCAPYVIKCRTVRLEGHVARMGEKRRTYRVWWGNLGKRDHLKDPGVDGRIIVKCIFKKWDGDMDWIDLAQDRYRWRTVVNAVMNFRVL